MSNGKIDRKALLRLHEDATRDAAGNAAGAAAAPPPRRWRAATRCAPSALQ